MLTMIIGGVRSGKSGYAERLMMDEVKADEVLHYIATSAPYDEEMKQRVKRHQDDRRHYHHQWKTWEQPRHVEQLAASFTAQDRVLLDCLTNLVSNELFVGWEAGLEPWREPAFRQACYEKIRDGIRQLTHTAGHVVVVSNEIGHETVWDDEATLYYGQLLGALHQTFVAEAERVLQMEYGLPLLRKGAKQNG
ncbi:cobinamide kinase/cobinamide phosphate guanylyltransferase [Fictibacillus macauensis ZFHKF-1]|uniref:Adenosylcobinamide kinase n=1 Tax=Fictibacillus macauensis ZFHKF-1 TaxID=1196324 RepID=I8AM75_9BACL|nr:bifunctional adenosylcobinamide kinase/adenosylcobinamide-phosphate guanylyltransferase [Fictibacillus macauensis]EIT87052.1 cobinamide kinase/cobinamide phosphate guanylyltransferase [Fictibacillus macauensis ZFHKF-1]